MREVDKDKKYIHDIEKGEIKDNIQAIDDNIVFGDNENKNNISDEIVITEEELQSEFINSINDK